MNFASTSDPAAAAGEALLRAELAEGAAVRAATAPVLKQLVTSLDAAAFSEEVVARTRGQIRSLAENVLRGAELPAPGDEIAEMTAALVNQPAVLSHCHALALEARLTERLASEAGLDPVLSMLLQARRADPEADVGALAGAVLAAQARFVQAQRRMELALEDLPADVLHPALIALGEVCGGRAGTIAATIRARYDESLSRHGLLARLVLQLGPALPVALDPAKAGLAIFLTALSFATMRERTDVLQALGDGQQGLLATMLSAAGVPPAQIEACLLLLHPDRVPQPYHVQIGRERAQALLAGEGQR